METNKFKAILGILRLSLGLIFLWAFFDKVFGLGYATTAQNAWLVGGSPTTGFLQFGVHGPFAGFFHSLASVEAVDWLFMLGLAFIGTTLTLGIMTKIGGWAGIILLFSMYLAVGLPPEHHPFIDEHFIYIFVLLAIVWSNAGIYFGFGNQWARTKLVQKFKLLR